MHSFINAINRAISCLGVNRGSDTQGKTNKGKNRIREHGEVWKFLNGNPLRPNMLSIKSVKTGEERWLTEDFDIVLPDRF